MRYSVLTVLLLLLGLSRGAAVLAAPPDVVVSIKPLHSLVAGIMGELGEPFLLIKGAQSPHSYSLRPSEARALEAADLVVWVGPGLEGFLQKPLAALAGRARLVELAKAEGIALLERREGGAWPEHDAEHDAGEPDADEPDADEPDGLEHGREPALYNMHLWLDPRNAAAIVQAVQAALADLDPENAPRYRRNAEAVTERLAALDDELGAMLTPVKDRPYVVFHDAYHYFERRYGLNAVGSMTIDPDQAPGARRMTELRERIVALGAACVFSEPQFEPALVQTLVRGLAVKTAILDPLGADLAAGEAAYFTLMRDLAQALVACLEPTS